MITLTNGTYSRIALTLSENIAMNGIASGNDLDISGYFYYFRIEDKMSGRTYDFAANGSTMSSGDINAGSGAWTRWNGFDIGLNLPGATASDRWTGGMLLPDIDEGQWEYKVYANVGQHPTYPDNFWLFNGAILLESGRLHIKI